MIRFFCQAKPLGSRVARADGCAEACKLCKLDQETFVPVEKSKKMMDKKLQAYVYAYIYMSMYSFIYI